MAIARVAIILYNQARDFMSSEVTTYPMSLWEHKPKPILFRPHMIAGLDDILIDSSPSGHFGFPNEACQAEKC